MWLIDSALKKWKLIYVYKLYTMRNTRPTKITKKLENITYFGMLLYYFLCKTNFYTFNIVVSMQHLGLFYKYYILSAVIICIDSCAQKIYNEKSRLYVWMKNTSTSTKKLSSSTQKFKAFPAGLISEYNEWLIRNVILSFPPQTRWDTILEI